MDRVRDVRTTAGFGQSSPTYNVLNFFFYRVVREDVSMIKRQDPERRVANGISGNTGRNKTTENERGWMRHGDHDRKQRARGARLRKMRG